MNAEQTAPKPPADGEPLAGISWRSPTLADAEALHRLVNLSEEADEYPMRTSLEELVQQFSDPGFELERDALAGLLGGELVCYAGAQLRVQTPDRRSAVLYGGVRPDLRRRGLGTVLLRWSEARATELLAGEPAGIPRYTEAWSDERKADRRALFTSQGYQPIRYYNEMIRPLAQAIPEAPLSAPLRFAPWSEELDEGFRLAHNEAFADHWGSTPVAADTWRHRYVGWPSFRPELTFCALDGDEIAGYCVTYHSPQDSQATGRLEGWLGQIGVRRPWRKRGVASSLICHAMRQMQAAGLDHAALAVDSDNPTGAVGLYERLGFVTEHREIRWAKEIPEASAQPR